MDQREYYRKLRDLILEHDHITRKERVLLPVLIGAGIATIVFPLIGLIGLAALGYMILLRWRLCQAHCPRCEVPYLWLIHRILPISTDVRGWKCPRCHSAVSDLPELESPVPFTKREKWPGN